LGRKDQRFHGDKVEIFGYFSKSYSGYPPGDVKMLLGSINNP